MEAIGEHLAGSVGDADDAGTWLPRMARLHAVPAVDWPQPGPQFLGPGPVEHDLLGGLASQLNPIKHRATRAVLGRYPDLLGRTKSAVSRCAVGFCSGLSKDRRLLRPQ